MAKLNSNINIKLNKNTLNEMIKQIKVQVNETILKEKNKLIEKIAFSLFLQHYYSYEFSSQSSELYYKLHLEKIKDVWIFGKEKNKLKFFFDLAEKIYELDLNNDNLNKENNNDD